MHTSSTVLWLDLPEEHNYPAAREYLSLVFPTSVVDHLIKELELAPVIKYKAKDVLRASELAILGLDNNHVNHNLKKINDGKKISPGLFVIAGGKLIIADSYHRSCSIYHFNEDEYIHGKFAYL